MVRNLDPGKYANFLNAARRLFVEQGVAHTSTAEIAKAAGTAAGTLFLYFPTKQALVDALALELSRAHASFVRARLAPEMGAREMFFAIWQGSLEWFVSHPEDYRYLRQIRDADIVSPEMVEETGKELSYYFEAIQKGLEEGCLKALDPSLIGEVLYQDIVAVMEHLRRTAGENVDEMIGQGFEIFWDGVRKRE